MDIGSCPVHNKEFKESKYKKGEWYCPTKVGDKWCKEKPSMEGVAVKDLPSDMRFEKELDDDAENLELERIAVAEELKWKKINEEKNKNIRFLNALNNATLIVTSNSIPHEAISREDLEKEISQWAQWFMKQTP